MMEKSFLLHVVKITKKRRNLSVILPIVLALILDAVLAFHQLGERFRTDRQRVNLLDKLLVRAELLSAHDDVSELRVDLGVQPSVADKIYDPALGFLLIHVELVGKHPEGEQNYANCWKLQILKLTRW